MNLLFQTLRQLPAFVGAIALSQAGFAIAAEPIPNRPDPRQVPVPEIKTSLGKLPGVNELPVRKEMPDVFTMNDGTKVTTREQWAKRREEIRRTLEYYHVGRMPPPPGNVKGTEVSSQLLLNGKVKYRLIKLTFGPEEKLSLHVGIYAPAEGGAVPAVIQPGGSPPGAPALPRLEQGVGQGRGLDILLPVDVLQAQIAAADAAKGGGARGTKTPPPSAGPGTGSPGATPAAATAATPAAGRGGRGGFGGPVDPERFAASNAAIAHGFAYVTFNTNDCAEDTTLRMPDGSFAFRTTRFYPAYPGYDWGIIGGWVWGTMRVVDYLQNDPAIDKTKIIITGTSRIGKAAMISGAFDDRIALVAPGASSGLGTPAYRFSGDGRGGREGLTMMVRKYGNQFSPHLHQFWGQEDKLPYDAHWFPALTAPRPWIALEGTHDGNVVHNGVKQTWLAARPAYAFLGVADKVGVYWSDRPHGFGDTDWDGLLAFADKHLLGKRVSRAFDLFPATDELPAAAGDRE
jgi:hypothetical protein